MTSLVDSPTASSPAVRQRPMPAVVVGAALALGPALIAAVRFVMPYDTTDSAATALAKVTAHPHREAFVLAATALAIAIVIPAYARVARLCREAAPLFTQTALVLSFVGYLGLAISLMSDQALAIGAAHPQGATSVAMVHHFYTAPLGVAATVVFVVGHVLGTVLLGVALLRTRAVLTWAAVAVLASQPLHFVFAVILANHPLDALSWLLLATGFGLAARTR